MIYAQRSLRKATGRCLESSSTAPRSSNGCHAYRVAIQLLPQFLQLFDCDWLFPQLQSGLLRKPAFTPYSQPSRWVGACAMAGIAEVQWK